MDSIIFFPLNQILGLIFSTIVSLFVFKEGLNKQGAISIVIGLLAIFLLNF
ncbi:MAG: hypothetical protein PHP06_08040 [Clostridia bacterium]|nr:hypothetical protein [Clostridia bacterium]